MNKNNVLSFVAIVISAFALAISFWQLCDNKFNWQHEIYVQEECRQWINLEHVLNDLDGSLSAINDSKMDNDIYGFLIDVTEKTLNEYGKSYVAIMKYARVYGIEQDLIKIAVIHGALQEAIQKHPYEIISVNGEMVHKYKIQNRQKFIQEVNALLKNSHYKEHTEHVNIVLDKQLTKHLHPLRGER